MISKSKFDPKNNDLNLRKNKYAIAFYRLRVKNNWITELVKVAYHNMVTTKSIFEKEWQKDNLVNKPLLSLRGQNSLWNDIQELQRILTDELTLSSSLESENEILIKKINEVKQKYKITNKKWFETRVRLFTSKKATENRLMHSKKFKKPNSMQNIWVAKMKRDHKNSSQKFKELHSALL